MNTPITSTSEHYDRMIDEIDDPAQPMLTDPFYDTGRRLEWTAQADGPAFWNAVGDVRGKTVLEAGAGV